MRAVRIIFVVVFVVYFSSLVKAQDVPNYLFLEVVDSKEKPVKDAVVNLMPPAGAINLSSDEAAGGRRTDENGDARFVLYHFRSDVSNSIFKISKTGYFDFFDLGVPVAARDRTSVKIELLKIPETKSERKTLGDEQLKREFMWAAKSGDAGKIHELLKKGISPNLTTDDLRGITAPKNIPVILFAAASGSRDAVAELLKAGADLRRDGETNHNILAYYLRADSSSEDKLQTDDSARKYQDGIKILVESGAGLNNSVAPYVYRSTLWNIVVDKRNLDTVKTLVDQGLSANAQDGSGETALFYAVSRSNEKMVNLLLDLGADPNIPAVYSNSNDCQSILMNAVQSGNPQIVKSLIEHKANVNFACRNGKTALQIARQQAYLGARMEEIINLLEATGAK